MDIITFNLPGRVGPFTIRPTAGLPVISDPVLIDGTTQPGYANAPIIELDGSLAGAGVSGLEITAGDTTIRGLIINRFHGKGSAAVFIQGGGGNHIEGNYLGTDASGTQALSNATVVTDDTSIPCGGILIQESANNNIGGTTPGDANLISGNFYGVILYLSQRTLLQGNLIGTDASGTQALGNGFRVNSSGKIVFQPTVGVQVGDSDGTKIGGTEAGAANIIAGNDPGIDVSSNSITIQGNMIGTDIHGAVALGNYYGIELSGGSDVVIGGTADNAGNLISGNLYGIFANAEASSFSNIVIQGNIIGADSSGKVAVSNQIGLNLYSIMPLSLDILIGGDQPGARNIISGNAGYGVLIMGPRDVAVQGNYIGTDITGTQALPNSTGVVVMPEPGQSQIPGSNLIGGATTGTGNVISGNANYGVYLNGGDNQVKGNLIGVDSSGMNAIGNGLDGVLILDGANNTIGGTTVAAHNIIAGNARTGVLLSGVKSTGNAVQGNLIGVAGDGISALGNGASGVRIDAGGGNVIGGAAANAGNTIAFNGQHGIAIAAGVGNAILGNSIVNNAGLGIDLGNDGVTLNDIGDNDAGANNRQNFPLTHSAIVANGTTVIQGSLDGIPDTNYTLELFLNASCDATGYGEGAIARGSFDVAADRTGAARFAITLPIALPDGRFVTFTATDPNHNTSEFSLCKQIVWTDQSTRTPKAYLPLITTNTGGTG